MAGLLTKMAGEMIGKAETRLGVSLDYAHHIARTDIRLLMRYNRLFGMIDPRKHLPAAAYHAARIRGAMAADCGTCVEAEINLAKQSNVSAMVIDEILAGQSKEDDLQAVIDLTDAVTHDRQDAPEARAKIIQTYGDAGLIELSMAMNGAAMLPGIKRAMGYATACDMGLMRRIAQA